MTLNEKRQLEAIHAKPSFSVTSAETGRLELDDRDITELLVESQRQLTTEDTRSDGDVSAG